MLRKVVSGGQTGVDRAGLDAAFHAGIPIGGYCPQGSRAEDGIIPDKYPMIETEEFEYRFRTEKNVIESDGTLILNKGDLTNGTKATYDFTVQHGKPCLIVQLDTTEIIKPEQVIRWLEGQFIKVLNVAGPRESKYPEGIYADAVSYLEKVFLLMKEID
jgi:hypothetical protein